MDRIGSRQGSKKREPLTDPEDGSLQHSIATEGRSKGASVPWPGLHLPRRCRRKNLNATRKAIQPGRRHKKKTAPVLTGAKLPWFSRVARALLAANGGVAVGAERSLRGVATQHYCCSAPVEDAIPWGDVEPWAAKLFSINLICTVLGTRSR